MSAPWMLLRGLMREARHWGAFPQALSHALNGAPVQVLDLPGNGARWQDTSPARVADMADELARLWAQQHGGPVNLLALSMGGMVAVEWALRAPDTVTRLVLCNSSLRPYSPPWARMQPKAWPSLLRLLLRPPDDAVVEREILALTSAIPETHQHLLADWTKWRNECPVSRANVARQLWAAARYSAPRPPQVPVQILCSDGDQLVSAQCSRAVARAWQVPLAVHPSAGHDLPLDAADWVIRQLVDFQQRA